MSREGNLKGAEREALVVAELSRLGFETFIGNGNTTCDIIAMKNGLCLRIEVKGLASGHTKNPSGPVCPLSVKSKSLHHASSFDILVRVNLDNELFWQRSVLHGINKASSDLPLREEYNPRTPKRYRKEKC